MTDQKPRVRVRAYSQPTAYVRSTPVFDAAGTGRRSEGISSGNVGPNVAALYNLPRLVRHSRHLARNNPWAKTALRKLTTNVVGTGMRPVSSDKKLQRLFEVWSEVADADGKLDFYGLQGLVIHSALEGGDAFARLRPRLPEDGLPVPMQVQLVEGEFCPPTLIRTEPGGNRTAGGLERDLRGRVVAFHMHRQHPNDAMLGDVSLETVRVPAASVSHVMAPSRCGELRGLPILTPAIVRLSDLDSYLDAEAVRKRTAALYGGFITTPGTEDDAEVLAGVGATHEDSQLIDPLEPGTFPILPPGYDVSFSEPADVGGSFDAYMRVQLRSIASAVGLTYEQLSGDYSTVTSDRLFRVALLEFRRLCETVQWSMLKRFCQDVWRWFVDAAYLSGAWEPEPGTTVEDAYVVRWVAHGWSYLHPVHDVEASIRAMASNLVAPSEVIAGQGNDPDEVFAQIAEDRRKLKELGLIQDEPPAAA